MTDQLPCDPELHRFGVVVDYTSRVTSGRCQCGLLRWEATRVDGDAADEPRTAIELHWVETMKP